MDSGKEEGADASEANNGGVWKQGEKRESRKAGGSGPRCAHPSEREMIVVVVTSQRTQLLTCESW